MDSRKFALIAGILMLALGGLALVPELNDTTASLPSLEVETSYGLAFGVFPMNIFNKMSLILFGIAGIFSSRERSFSESTTRTTENGTVVVGGDGWSTPVVGDPQASSILWSRVVAVLMGTLAILGFFASTRTLFGTWPLFGTDALMHGLFALFGALYGFGPRKLKARAEEASSEVKSERAA